MKNRKWIIPLIIMGLVILTNCKKDKDSSGSINLSGTEWKTAGAADEDYWLLKFTGNTSVQIYQNWNSGGNTHTLDLFSMGSYTLDGNNIALDWDDTWFETSRGVINGNQITIFDLYSVDEVFIKQ